jgi:hypothetical protein
MRSDALVIDQTSPEWDTALQRALRLLTAVTADASLVDLEHKDEIVAFDNALRELANLALSLVGAASTSAAPTSRARGQRGRFVLRASGGPVDLDRYALRVGSRVDQV